MSIDQTKKNRISWSTTFEIWWIFMRFALIATVFFTPILSLAYAVDGNSIGLGANFMLTAFAFMTASLFPSGSYILANALKKNFVASKALAGTLFRSIAWRLYIYPILFAALCAATYIVFVPGLLAYRIRPEYGTGVNTTLVAVCGFLLVFLPASLLAFRHALNKHLDNCHDSFDQNSSPNISTLAESTRSNRCLRSALLVIVASGATVMAVSYVHTEQLTSLQILGVVFYFLTGLCVAYGVCKIKYIARFTPEEESELDEKENTSSNGGYTTAAGFMLGSAMAKWNLSLSSWLELLLILLLGLVVLGLFFRLLGWMEKG